MSKTFKDSLRCLSYHTEFSAEGTKRLSMARRACFSELLNYGTRVENEHYKVIIYNDPNIAVKASRSNYCPFGKESLKKHIHQARRLFEFTYNIVETSNDYSGKSYSCFEVTIDLSGPKIYHRYLLTWLRYSYEFPFNLILMNAFRLKDTCIKEETIPNLFVLVANCFYGGPSSYNTGHSISYQSCKFLKEKTLKDRIKKANSVNEIYPRYSNLKLGRIDPGGNSCYLDYWTDIEEFDKRSKVYVEAYKKLKNSKS